MERAKIPGKFTAAFKTKIYMDLREIVQEHALRYLPAKSLYRFKAVCKAWKRQISIPFFEHNQSVAFRSISGLFCQSPEGSISFVSFDKMAYGVVDPELKFLPEPVDLLASSHGLVCCRGRSGEKAYYICNPVNQKWKKLPKPAGDHGQNTVIALVFEPSVLDFVADYKLVCAFPSTDFDGAYEFEIYSSTEDSWKISSEICFGENGRILKAGGFYVNGMVYWLSNNYAIIGFDLKKHRVKVFWCYELLGRPTLGVMDGKLCASIKRGSEVSTMVLSNEYANTMHMHAGSKTWEKKTVRVGDADASSSTAENNNNEATGVTVSEVTAGHLYGGVHVSEGILLAVESGVIVYPKGKRILSYNMRTKETEEVNSEAEFSHTNVYVPYVNSLVCL